MAFCISSATITRPTRRRRPWRVSKSRCWHASACPIPTGRATAPGVTVPRAPAEPKGQGLTANRMPDSDPSSEGTPPATETRNLPVPVPRPALSPPDAGEGWFARALRTLFGWKAGSIRSDLADVLETDTGSAGFSPTESAMLRNILGLRERRVADVMLPRADIVGVQKEIVLGELLKVFASQGHSRLVVYD